MSVIIFGDLFTFPEGYAATNRAYMYAKGFSENSIRASVVCFSSEYLKVSDGIIDEIPYYHPFGQEKRSNSFVIRRWQNLMKYYRTYVLFKKIHKEDKIVAVNSWTNLLLTHTFAWFLCKIFKARLIPEISEHPLRYYQQGFFKKKIGVLKFHIETRLSDGFFCISRYLVNFYKQQGVNTKKLFLVPSIIDPSRFSKVSERPFSHSYIGYFGSLTFERDNVDLLINAFEKFARLHPDIHLVLGGFCTDAQKKQISNLISKLDIDTKVTLLDRLTKDEITKYVAHASILVMVRTKGLESDASFPSKLTEFLATGKPVISVNVGEIPDYLSDGVNVFLTEPGNAQELTNKLIYIANDYAVAERVSKQGKSLTLDSGVFNYSYQTRRMIDFINSLHE